MLRLQQEFQFEVSSQGYYIVEPNLVIVREVNKREIIFTLQNLYKQKYFEEIKPLDSINTDELIEIK